MAFPRSRARNARGGYGSENHGGGRGGGRVATREPEHHEKGYRPHMSAHMSHGSMDSNGARKGNGPVAGAGELEMPFVGPGAAGRRKAGMDSAAYPSRKTPSTPSGVKVEREGE